MSEVDVIDYVTQYSDEVFNLGYIVNGEKQTILALLSIP